MNSPKHRKEKNHKRTFTIKRAQPQTKKDKENSNKNVKRQLQSFSVEEKISK